MPVVVPVVHGVAMPLFHPWRALRALPQIDLSWPTLAAELGRTDGVARIEIDRRLGQAARRCVLAHELAHVLAGHGCRQPAAAEKRVRVYTARKLLPLPILTGALAYTVDLDYVAWDCWVTRDVLDDRLESLTAAEHDAIMAATAHHRDSA